MLGRAFTEEEDSAAEDSSGLEPEYSFAGFNVEFSEKIALTPAAAPGTAAAGRAAGGPSNNGHSG